MRDPKPSPGTVARVPWNGAVPIGVAARIEHCAAGVHRAAAAAAGIGGPVAQRAVGLLGLTADRAYFDT